MKDSTAPLDASERAATARLMEAARDALRDKRLGVLDRLELAAHLAGALDDASLCVRRGYREARLDAIVGELDRYLHQLANAAPAPKSNPADPFTVRESERPVTNSGP